MRFFNDTQATRSPNHGWSSGCSSPSGILTLSKPPMPLRLSSATLMALIMLFLPLAPGCDRHTSMPTQPRSTSAPLRPSTAVIPSKSLPPRSIQFHGMDNDYRGSSRVLPNGRLAHQKDAND